MEKEKKYFLSEDSQLNADDSPFAVSQNSWVNGQNWRTKSTDTGVTGVVESIGGTLLLSQPQPSINFLTIGSANEVPRARFCEFKFCTTGPWHKIVCWDETLQQELDVLLSSQYEGGLNFDKNYLIHNAYIVDNLLYWTDNLNEPHKINIDAGIKLNNPSYVTDQAPYASPVFYTTATLIKRPPVFPLDVTKVTDSTYDNNFTYNVAIQATYRYYYRDNEISALAPFGSLAPFNFTVETFNAIDLQLPFSEYIDDDIQIVEICIRYGNTGGMFAIKRWDKASAADAAAIALHNSDTTQLSYRYYNDVTGNPLDSIEANTSFHGVPLLSKTLSFSKNRILLGNNLFGYDTPTTTSLALSLDTFDTGNAGTFPADWKYITIQYQQQNSPYNVLPLTFYYAYEPTLPAAYYFIDYTNVVSPPASFDSVDATSVWATELQLGYYIARTYVPPVGYHPLYTGWTFTDTGNNTDIIITVPDNGLQFFKSSSTYNVSIAFYDRFRRKCGVVDVTNKVTIPERTFNQSVFSTIVNWALSNNNAVEEIPDWAYYYQIHITKSLTTRFFVQGYTGGPKYAIKDTDTGAISYVNTFSSGVTYALALNLGTLTFFGLGYSYQAGDMARLHLSPSTNYNQNVIGQDGVYALLTPVDLGDLSGGLAILYELYTPYHPLLSEPFFEEGDVFPVLSPGTSVRSYSVLFGSIYGDCYAIKREITGPTTFFTEAMSPNDLTWQFWEQDRGWTNYVDKLGQNRHTSDITWSDVIIPGTRTNGLNVFQPLSRKDLPIECGAIQKLQLTSKVQDEIGDIILSICQLQTVSIYIGQSQVISPTGDAFLATSTEVIGTLNVLKGNRGTTHPESVQEYRGNVFWWDDINGKYVQYSANGLFDISSYKMARFWNLFTLQFNSMTVSEIEALGSRPFVFSTIDPNHNELLISVPKLLNDPPKGYLPDYTNEVFPFDIWDGRGKTLVYKLDTGIGRPFWQVPYSFNPEWFTTLLNKLYSFKYGHIYLHNQVENLNEFYGVKYTSKIMIVGNQLANKPKEYNNLASESNLVPSFVYMYNNDPLQQSSDLVDNDFRAIEGAWFAKIFRNKLVPTADGYTTDGLLTGGKMKNAAMWIMFEWRIEDTPLELRFLNIGYNVSRGYNI